MLSSRGAIDVATTDRTSLGERVKDAAASRSEIADEALMIRFQSGDRSAFTLLVRRHQSPLYNFALRQLRSPSAAEEVVQDAFVRVVHNAAEFKHAARFSTWLYTITRNLCIDHVRKRSAAQPSVARRAEALGRRRGSDGPTLGERTADSAGQRGADGRRGRDPRAPAGGRRRAAGRAARGLPLARGLERPVQGDRRDRGRARRTP